ncbi:hypothetical protein HPB50_012046 [Hyalomma asiaticum]|uniref:Uncharacterized protein n=1 Tax=Hyalomma asiaticum TaxID=266040 RepID=A0ACB7TJI0_HYAAI|nr:hypothetical protein HPB50_012046 [Hyalomma asiaticum]
MAGGRLWQVEQGIVKKRRIDWCAVCPHTTASGVVCGALTDEEIISEAINLESVTASDNEEEEDNAPVQPPSAEVIARLIAPRLLPSFEEGKEKAFCHIHELEQQTAGCRP